MTARDSEWSSLDRYLALIDRAVERACSYFITEPNLFGPNAATPRILRIHGDLFCQGDLVIHMDNYIRVNDDNQVRGAVYRYQAQFTNIPLRQIFRYDNSHTYTHEAHPDAFHKHVFNDRTWKEAGVEHVGRERFPTLLEVIDELYDWWLQHRDDPLIYP